MSWNCTTCSIVVVAGGLKPNCQGLGPPSANVAPLKLNRLVKKNKTFFTKKNLPSQINYIEIMNYQQKKKRLNSSILITLNYFDLD